MGWGGSAQASGAGEGEGACSSTRAAEAATCPPIGESNPLRSFACKPSAGMPAVRVTCKMDARARSDGEVDPEARVDIAISAMHTGERVRLVGHGGGERGWAHRRVN